MKPQTWTNDQLSAVVTSHYNIILFGLTAWHIHIIDTKVIFYPLQWVYTIKVFLNYLFMYDNALKYLYLTDISH